MLPRNLGRAPRHVSPSIRVSPLLAELAEAEPAVVLERLGSSQDGLSEEEAARRLERYGPNVVASDERHTRLRLLLRACLNPLVLLLAVLAVVSLATGDVRAAAVMTVMIVLGVSLRFAPTSASSPAATCSSRRRASPASRFPSRSSRPPGSGATARRSS